MDEIEGGKGARRKRGNRAQINKYINKNEQRMVGGWRKETRRPGGGMKVSRIVCEV